MVAEAISDEAGLTAEQLVTQITAVNPTATHEFLARFSTRALSNYLRHLHASQEPRGRTARWLRPDETPAIMRWEPAH